MIVLTETASAKVNLWLRVLGRRADGYHEIVSLVAFAALGDEVAVDPARPPDVETRGPFAPDITGRNLVQKTLDLLASRAPALKLGRVQLTKTLPVAAGLGGGSADVAAVLRAVRDLNPDRRDGFDWNAIALQLGADVPVCLTSRAGVMRGIGERIAPCEIPPLPVLLVNPRRPVPADKTARVFQALGAGPVDGARALDVPARLDVMGLLDLMREVGNDLEAPALSVMPAISDVKAALLGSSGCLHAQLSGAGPTCFGLFASVAEAQAAGQAMAVANPRWWIAATIVG